MTSLWPGLPVLECPYLVHLGVLLATIQTREVRLGALMRNGYTNI